MKNNWLKSNKSIDVSACDATECTAVIDLRAENEQLQAENEKLKELNANHLKTINNFLQENNMLKEKLQNLTAQIDR